MASNTHVTVPFDAPTEAIDFDRTNLFAEHAVIPPRRRLTAPISLDAVLIRLETEGLAAGLQSYRFCGLTAWVSNPRNGVTAKGCLSSSAAGWRRDGSVAEWMIRTAELERPPRARRGRRSLEALIKRLAAREFNAGFELLAPSKGLRVWIGDELDGIGELAVVNPADTAEWLHQTARKMVRDHEGHGR
jgi:hypothetical protein